MYNRRRPYYGGRRPFFFGAPFLGGLVGGLLGSALLYPGGYYPPYGGGYSPPYGSYGYYPY